MDYCQLYQFSFKEKEVNKYISPEEWWFKRFGHGPAWGKNHSPAEHKSGRIKDD